jgi:uncharacterized membrane protein
VINNVATASIIQAVFKFFTVILIVVISGSSLVPLLRSNVT